MQVTFNNPYSQQITPTATSYVAIDFDSDISLYWPGQTLTDSNVQYYVATVTVLNPSATNFDVSLPTIEFASPGASFTLNNPSSFGIHILAYDGTGVVDLDSGESIVFYTTTNIVISTQAACWGFYVLGASTNTNTFSQNLGNSLRFIPSTNDVQVAQSVFILQNTLPLSNSVYYLDVDTAITTSGCTVINPTNTVVQVNVSLGVSSTLYAHCGYFGSFINEGTNPVVFQTDGDLINGHPSQPTDNDSTYVLVPGASCTLVSTPNNGWLVVNQSSQFQNIYRTATLNLSTANYVGLTTQALSILYSQSEILVDPLAGAAVAIDMSTNLDFMYSPLWIIEGEFPTDILNYYTSLGQVTFWILLPNNLNSVYFVLGNADTQGMVGKKFGVGARYGTGTDVGLPPLANSWPVAIDTSWPVQYSAQIISDPSTQLTSNLLFGGNGSGGGGSDANFPDILDSNGLVLIHGEFGLSVNPGPLALSEAGGTIGTREIAVVISGGLVGNLVTVGALGATLDSGKSITTSTNLTPIDNNHVPTTAGVVAYVSAAALNPYIIKGTWSATGGGGTPTLTDGSGTLGWAYICILGGACNFGSGAQTAVAGNYIIYNQSNQWRVVPNPNDVVSVNGQTGVVSLGLGDLSDVVLAAVANNDILKYDLTSGKWINAATPTMALSQLSDVSIVSPLEGQILVYDATVSKWVNEAPGSSDASDFNRITTIGSTYTITTADSYAFLNPNTTPTVTVPAANGFPIGFTVCVSSARGGTLNLTGALGTAVITMTSIYGFYKLEGNGTNWYVNYELYNVYSDMVTNASLNSGTLPANFTTCTVATSPVVTNATLNGGTLPANLTTVTANTVNAGAGFFSSTLRLNGSDVLTEADVYLDPFDSSDGYGLNVLIPGGSTVFRMWSSFFNDVMFTSGTSVSIDISHIFVSVYGVTATCKGQAPEAPSVAQAEIIGSSGSPVLVIALNSSYTGPQSVWVSITGIAA